MNIQEVSGEKTKPNKLKIIGTTLLFCLVLVSCGSNESTSNEVSLQNKLSDLSPADTSATAYKRACYWANEGSLILMNEKMKEANDLAVQEGKLPVLGVAQAMDFVTRKGIPQAQKQWEMVKSFCDATGVFIFDGE